MAKTKKTKAKKAKKTAAKKTSKSAANTSAQKQLITKDMTLGDAITRFPGAGEVMFKHGLHCIGCHISAFETIEQGAAAHGIDLKTFLDDLNAVARKKK
jgi:hybrid cluster-associated redox disulfide protein